MKDFNPSQIIDSTNIDRRAKEKDIKKLCSDAKKYGFRAACVNPEWVKLAKKELKSSDVKLIALLDSPMGLSPHIKRIEWVEELKSLKINELEIVMNVIDMKYERYDEILKDLKSIVKLIKTRVIIGSGYLTTKEIEKAAEIAKEAGAMGIKTATEKDPLEHIEIKEEARHIKLIKEKSGLEVKSAGKVETYKDLLFIKEEGADLIGTNSAVKIMAGYKQSKTKKKNG